MDLFKKYGNLYKPYELGFDLPECRGISLDKCAANPKDWRHFSNEVASWGWNAHAHMCALDKNYKVICTPDWAIKNSDGSMSDLLIHEYAHIISDLPTITHVKSPTGHAFSDGFVFNDQDEWEVYAHGDVFLDALIKLGRPDLHSRSVTLR